MDAFNTAVKSLQDDNSEKIINGIRMIRNKSLDTTVNGVSKSITVGNLPNGYSIILGIDDNDTIKIKDKKVYGKYYIKVYDTFNREIKDFLSNHRLTEGLNISFKLSNIDSPSILVKSGDEKLGYFNSDTEEFNITIYDDKPLVVSSSKANSPDNADPSTWWIIGGIIAAIILIMVLSYLYYTKYYNSKNPAMQSMDSGKSEMMYKTPRFPPRYYNFY
jgi:hypothetical protein